MLLTSCINPRYLLTFFISYHCTWSKIISSSHIPIPIKQNICLQSLFWNKNSSTLVNLFQISLPQWQPSAFAKTTNKSQRGVNFPWFLPSPQTASLVGGSTTKCRHFEMGTAPHTKPATTTRFYTNPWTLCLGPCRPLGVCKCRAVEGPVLLWLSWIGQARR